MASYDQEVLADTPLAYWRLNETTGQALDSSTNARNGNYINSPTLNQAGFVATGASVLFNGSSQYVECNSLATFTDVAFDQITLEAWFNTTENAAVDADNQILGANTSSGDNTFLFGTAQNGGIYVNTNTGGTVTGSGYNDGNDHHVVVVFSASSFEVFVDGASIGVQFELKPNNATAATYSIGMEFDVGTPSGHFNGRLGEVAFYGYGLSSARVQAHYDARNNPFVEEFSDEDYSTTINADSPIAWWRLDDDTTTAIDETGNYNGTHGGSLTLQRSPLIQTGNSVGYPGATGGVTNLNTIATQIPSLTNFTLEGWLATTQTGWSQVPVPIGINDSAYNNNALLCLGREAAGSNEGVLSWRVYKPSSDRIESYGKFNNLNSGEPYHFAITVAGTVHTMYINGRKVSEATLSTGWGASATFFSLGLEYDPGAAQGNWYEGDLDEVAVYDTALTPERVYQHWLAGIKDPGQPDPPDPDPDPDPDPVPDTPPVQTRTAFPKTTTKPRYTPDRAQTKDPVVNEWVNRQLDRVSDLWPEDYQTRLEALEKTWPYLTGSWPIVDIAELKMATVSFRSPLPSYGAAAVTRVGSSNYRRMILPAPADEWFTDDWVYEGTGSIGSRSANLVYTDTGIGSMSGSVNPPHNFRFSTTATPNWQTRGEMLPYFNAQAGTVWLHYHKANDEWYAVGNGLDSAGYGTHIVTQKSTDGGWTWELVSAYNIPNKTFGPYGMAFKNDDVWGAIQGRNVSGTDSGYILRTTDAGKTWNYILAALESSLGGPVRYARNGGRMTYCNVRDKWYISGAFSSGSTTNYLWVSENDLQSISWPDGPWGQSDWSGNTSVRQIIANEGTVFWQGYGTSASSTGIKWSSDDLQTWSSAPPFKESNENQSPLTRAGSYCFSKRLGTVFAQRDDGDRARFIAFKNGAWTILDDAIYNDADYIANGGLPNADGYSIAILEVDND